MQKGYIFSLVLTLAFFFTVDIATAQTYNSTPVEISSTIVKQKGEAFYVHEVQAKQTLYSISKKYAISIEDIYKYNDDAKLGLKTGSLLYIPVKKGQSTGITYSDLSKKNLNKLRKHKVKWYEIIDDIAEEYGVSVEELMAFNNLDSKKLKKRSTLYIPDMELIKSFESDSNPRSKSSEGSAKTSVSTSNSSVHLAQSSAHVVEGDVQMEVQKPIISEADYEYYTYSKRGRKHIITLILPFNAGVDPNKAISSQLDFYAGVELAISDLQAQYDLSEYTLNVVDISDYTSAKHMINSGVLKGSELIIGPVISSNIEEIAIYAKENKIPLVSPLDARSEYISKDNPYYFLFPTPNDIVQLENIAKLAPIDANDTSKVLVVYEKSKEFTSNHRKTIESLNTLGIAFDTLGYNFLDGRGVDTLLMHKVDTLALNKVFIASEEEAFVADAIRNIYLLQSRSININLYGSPKWKNIESLELKQLHALNTYITLSSDIDYSSPLTLEFIKKYKSIYKIEPSLFAYRGYDLASYFISAICIYGRDFPLYLSVHKKELIQTTVDFKKRNPNDGFINHGTRGILYTKNWSTIHD